MTDMDVGKALEKDLCLSCRDKLQLLLAAETDRKGIKKALGLNNLLKIFKNNLCSSCLNKILLAGRKQ